MVAQHQPGILADVPRVSRYLSFQIRPEPIPDRRWPASARAPSAAGSITAS